MTKRQPIGASGPRAAFGTVRTCPLGRGRPEALLGLFRRARACDRAGQRSAWEATREGVWDPARLSPRAIESKMVALARRKCLYERPDPPLSISGPGLGQDAVEAARHDPSIPYHNFA